MTFTLSVFLFNHLKTQFRDPPGIQSAGHSTDRCCSATTWQYTGHSLLRRDNKAFILAEIVELSLNYDNTYINTLPVEFLHVKPDRVQRKMQELWWLTNNLAASLKWLFPELSFSDRWSRGTKLWERDWLQKGISPLVFTVFTVVEWKYCY